MNISSYWYFKSALTPKFCDDIIEYGLSKKLIRAETGNQQLLDKPKLNKKQIKDLKKIRDSEIVWLDEPWIYREIHPYIHTANKNAGWNFEWDFSESCQNIRIINFMIGMLTVMKNRLIIKTLNIDTEK